MNYFDINNIPPVNLGRISITHEGTTLKMSWNDTGWYLTDDSNYINQFAQKLLDTNLNAENVLIGGLGMGTIAEWLIRNKNVSNIDVLESNLELTSWYNSSGHLNPLVNIIETDALSYTPTKNYNLIIMDLWFPREDRIATEVISVKSRYTSYLNSGGKLYIPIDKQYLFTN